jgi:drug/metabolite transporter (DMT)-like permease
MTFASMFLDEPVTGIQITGAALVLTGVLIISLHPRPAQD